MDSITRYVEISKRGKVVARVENQFVWRDVERREDGSVNNDRMLHLDGALNARDLGGYLTNEGRTTRWGRLFRSDTVSALSARDLELLRDRGIVSVIDLRTPSEIAYTGRGPLEHSSVALIETESAQAQRSTSSSDETHADSSLDDVYWRYVTLGSDNFVRAIRVLAQPETYPALVSCFFGKDRTGVLVGLVLSCLGVQRDLIIDDYARSAAPMANIVERLRLDPVYRDTLDQTPDWRLAAPPATMATLLARLDERYGDARSWARSVGVSADELEQLSDALLD